MRIDRLFRLASRTLCLAAIPIVLFAFWDPMFYPLTIKEILIEAVAALAFLCWWISGGPSRALSIPNPIARPLGYLCLFALLSILWTPAKQIALAHWIAFGCLLLFFPPLLDFGKAPHFRCAFRNTIFLVAMVLLLLAAFQINGYRLDQLLRVGSGNSRQRLSLTIGHNNGVAPFILVTSFLAISVIPRVRKWSLRFGFIAFTLSCWTLIIFFLLTRSSILGLLFGCVLLVGMNLWPLVRRRQEAATVSRPRILRWALALCLVVLVGLISGGVYMASKGSSIQGEFNPNLARNIVDRLGTFNPQFLWIDTRARLWAISFVMMKHYPLLGIGFSAAKIHYPFYQAVFFEANPDFPAGPTINHTEGMHNDYLQWAVECGAVGLVILGWLLLVLGKVALQWMRTLKAKSAGVRFSESAILVSCVVLMMDAVFSFPAHIAPVAICVPGLAMLWFGSVYTTAKRVRQVPFLGSSIPLWGKLAMGLAAWVVFALPVASGKTLVPILARMGIWSPLTAQVDGSAWHPRLVGVQMTFSKQLKALSQQIDEGTFVKPEELANTVQNARGYLTRAQRLAELIPFSGDAIYDCARGVDDIYRFLKSTGGKVMGQLTDGGQTSKIISREYGRTTEVLLQAESLYLQAMRNYRYHGLYWNLGLLQLDQSSLPGTPPETRNELVKSGLSNLETARRIFGTDERILAEILASLYIGEREGLGQKFSRLLEMNPWLITSKVIPDPLERKVERSPEGQLSLKREWRDFFETMLRHLGSGPGDLQIIHDALPLLARGGEADIAKEYLSKKSENLPEPFGSPFWRMRLEDRPKRQEDLSRLLEEYHSKLVEAPGLPLVTRALFLSDLQRFAPPDVDLTEWRQAVIELLAASGGRAAGILCLHMLAQDAAQRGSLQEAWQWNLRALSETTVSNYASITDRRPGAVDAELWGITWPFSGN